MRNRKRTPKYFLQLLKHTFNLMAQACRSIIWAFPDEVSILVLLKFISKKKCLFSLCYIIPNWQEEWNTSERYDNNGAITRTSWIQRKKSGRLVTQHSSSSAASVYNSIFGFSCNAWVKHEATSQNMILHLTNLGKKWDWCDANLPQHSSNTNLFAASTKIWKYKWGTCRDFLKLLINQRLSLRVFMFLPTTSSKTKPTFFPGTPVYCIPDPGENLQKTLLIA